MISWARFCLGGQSIVKNTLHYLQSEEFLKQKRAAGLFGMSK